MNAWLACFCKKGWYIYIHQNLWFLLLTVFNPYELNLHLGKVTWEILPSHRHLWSYEAQTGERVVEVPRKRVCQQSGGFLGSWRGGVVASKIYSKHHARRWSVNKINNYKHHTLWDEITYPFPNFNSCTVEVWEWISNFIPHLARHVITYPCWD